MIDRVAEAQEMQPADQMTNRELWRWRVERHPDRRWLWFGGRAWTYAEFDLEVRRLQAGLREVGVAAGQPVLIGMSNRPEAAVAHLALNQLEAVCVPLVPGLPFSELAYPIAHSGARVLIADDPVACEVLAHRDECDLVERLVLLGEPAGAGARGTVRFEELAAAAPEPQSPAGAGGDVDALSHIVYTSGSTGRPKGVMIRAGCHYHCGLGYAEQFGFTSHDVYFQPLTFGHALGSVAGLGIPMFTGGSVALVDRFSPSQFWRQVDESGGTVSVLFPAHLNLLLETAGNGSGGAFATTLRLVVTHTDIPAFRQRFGVELGTIWGMSETILCVGSDPGYRGELGSGYVGRPFAGGEVGIFDDTFKPLGPYELGELAFRHPQVMLGYFKDPAATEAALIDGWVRSGDRGYMDRTGRAYFAGRYKAMIKRSGENISAEEVEAALLRHPGVAECAVIAVPDRIRAEEVGAVVVRRAGTAAEPPELRQACGEHLVRWKVPRYIVVRDEPLPRLPNGKIDRVRTVELLDPSAAWDAEAARGAGASEARER